MDSPQSLPAKTARLPGGGVRLGIAAFFFALTFAVYGASLGNGFSFLDDGLLIYENNAIRAINAETLRAIFTSYDPELYIPLTLFSYQIDYQIGEFLGLPAGGYSPVVYHFTNLLLHTLNALLVTWFVWLLLHSSPRHGILVSLLCGILFAVHPIHTETVAWASARKDVLSAFFFLASLVTYLQWHVGAPHGGARGVELPSKKWRRRLSLSGAPVGRPYVLSLTFFLLGLLSKVTIVTLPIILLLVDLLQQRKFNKRLILDKLPYFALSILFGLIALGGKEEAVGATTIADKALLAGKSTAFYLQKLFLPFNLSVFYPQLGDIRATATEFLVPLLFILLIAACVSILYLPFQYTSILKCLRLWRGNIAFGLAFFLITLSPSFLAVATGGNVFFASDRYAYLASIGVLYAFFSVMLGVDRRKFSIINFQFSIREAVLVIIVPTLTILTINQSLLWGNNVKMLERSIRLFPDFYMHYIALGAHKRLEKKPEEALAAYGKALSLNEMSNTHALIGQIHAEAGNYDRAIAQFQKGLAIREDDAELHYALGQVYALQAASGTPVAAGERRERALREYERSLELQPDDRTAYQKLSRRIAARRDKVYWRIGLLFGDEWNHDRAVEYHRKAIEENPSFADAHYNLAVGLGQLGRFDEAIAHYERAVALDPRHVKARINLGMLYANAGKRREAIEQFEKALKLEPRNALAREALQRVR